MIRTSAFVGCATAFSIGLLLCTAAPRTIVAAAANGDIVVRRVPTGALQPEVAVDARGTVHLIYFSGDPAGGDLFYVTSGDAGAAFSAPVRINSQQGSAIAVGTIRGGQIALGRSGRVHVTWNGSDKAEPRGPVNPAMKLRGAPFLYSRSTGTGSFEPQRNIAARTFTIDGGGSVAADGEGHVYAVWHGNREGDPGGEDRRAVWIARSDDDGATFAAESMAWTEPTGVCGCCQARAIALPSSSLAILFRSATNRSHRDVHALTSRDGGRTFTGSIVQPWEIDACPMTSMSLASDGAQVFAAWETNGQVWRGRIDPRSGGVTAVAAAPGPSSGRKHPRLAVSPSGESLLVWTENTGWSRGGSIAWRAYDAAGRPTSTAGTAPGLSPWSFATAVAKPGGGFVVFY
jgi:hypothetical protein